MRNCALVHGRGSNLNHKASVRGFSCRCASLVDTQVNPDDQRLLHLCRIQVYLSFRLTITARIGLRASAKQHTDCAVNPLDCDIVALANILACLPLCVICIIRMSHLQLNYIDRQRPN